MVLTILSVASPFDPLGQDPEGAADAVPSVLDAALVRAGHRSLVIAPDGSRVAGTLIPLPRVHGPLDEAARAAVHARVRATIAETLSRTAVDLVHLHDAGFHAHLPASGVPVLVTLHQPLDGYPSAALAPSRPATWLHGVSAAQQRAAPPGVRLLPPIETGVALDKLSIRVPKRRFAVAFGRIGPETGLHLALDAAALADMQILLSGAVSTDAEAQRYFREEIHTRLDGRRRFLGTIGFGRRRWMLGSARCLLVPNQEPEASALVAKEALACGTPVVGFPCGALADLIEPGVTGFLVNDVQEMADAIAAAEQLDPEVCRAAARARHSDERMAARYLALYEELVAREEREAGVA